MFKRYAILVPVLVAALSCASDGVRDYGRRPDWSFPLANGKKISAADFDGKVVIVDFWATWCPPCRKEIPGFVALQKKYADKGLAIVGFSFDREEEEYDKFLKATGVNYTSVFATNEHGERIINQFEKVVGDVRGLPCTLVIDRKGEIMYKHVGYGSPEDFERIILPMF